MRKRVVKTLRSGRRNPHRFRSMPTEDAIYLSCWENDGVVRLRELRQRFSKRDDFEDALSRLVLQRRASIIDVKERSGPPAQCVQAIQQ